MRRFVRAAGWERGYYWTEVADDGVRDAGQVPVEDYYELLRNQDSALPSLSLYHGPAGYQLLCLGLATRRNEPARRVITNSLLLEWPAERAARLFTAAVLATEGQRVFATDFETAFDHRIDHDTMRDHYHVDAPALCGLIEETITSATALGEPATFPDDVFLERLFARNLSERRRELQAALCRFELPAPPPSDGPHLLVMVGGLDDAQRLCAAGAWVALSERCTAEVWTPLTAHPARRDRC